MGMQIRESLPAITATGQNAIVYERSISTAFATLPEQLRPVACALLRDLASSTDLRGLSLADVAAILVGPDMRAVLEQEARLDSLDVARQG